MVRYVLPNLRPGRPDLTHRFFQPANVMSGTATQRHCATCHGVCHFARNRYLFFSSALFLLVFPIHSCFIAGFIPLLFLFVLVYIPSLPFPLCWLCAISFTHRYQSSCISYASGLLCSQYPLFLFFPFSFLFFSSLASAVKTSP